MKKILILFIFLTNFCFAQEKVDYINFHTAIHNTEMTYYLEGIWSIDQLITQKTVKEYTLHKREEKEQFFYGNNITFKRDGTFVSNYNARCGNNHTSTFGKYKIINEDYICFLLEKEGRYGNLGIIDFETNENVTKVEQELNLDLGLFRIYKENDKIQFYKSDGNPINDKKNLEYIEMLTLKSQELSSYFPPYTYINWKKMGHYNRFTKVEDIVAFIMAEHQVPNYEILADKGFPNANIVLLKIKNKYRYVVWKAKVGNIVEVEAALYDDVFFEELENLAHNTDKSKRLRKKVIKVLEYHSTNTQLKNTITLFLKNGKTKKLLYDIYSQYGNSKITFYYKENKPAVIKIETAKEEKFTYYIYDWKSDSAVMKPIVQGWSFSEVWLTYHQLIKKYDNT